MEAREFIKEANRMCNHYSNGLGVTYCGDCPANDVICNTIRGVHNDNMRFVDIVEDWSAKHPKITNADKLREVFGIEEIYWDCDRTTILSIKSKDGYLTRRWLGEEYKEPKEESNEQ